jgi:glyoxylase-like metal-dependent hydrolase (beta-lactamase superfamily II)
MTDGAFPVSVAQGVWRITTPMPYRPRSVHAYLVELSAGGWFLLDGGIDSEDAWSLIDGAVKSLVGGWRGLTLHIVTHMHTDHIGLTPRVRELAGGPLAMGALDSQRASHAAAEPEEEALYRSGLLLSCGAPQPFVDEVSSFTQARRAEPFARAEVEFTEDVAEIPSAPEWSAIWTPGHTAGHVSLFRREDRILLAGDVILPRVTPTIGVNRQRVDPIADYHAALQRISSLDPATALCGHGDVLIDPQLRVNELRAATQTETGRAEAALGGQTLSVWDVVNRLYPGRDLPPGPRMLALRETLAHLRHLQSLGRIVPSDHEGTELFSSRQDEP